MVGVAKKILKSDDAVDVARMAAESQAAVEALRRSKAEAHVRQAAASLSAAGSGQGERVVREAEEWSQREQTQTKQGDPFPPPCSNWAARVRRVTR